MKDQLLGLLLLLGLCGAGCTSTGQPIQLLTPIPDVSTAQRLNAAKKCSDGALLAGLSAASIAIITEESVKGVSSRDQVIAAGNALLEAKKQGVGQAVLDACVESAGYAERARAIRAAQPK